VPPEATLFSLVVKNHAAEPVPTISTAAAAHDGIQITDREAVEPGLPLARKAPKPGTSPVPLGDVDSIGSALAEKQHSHDGPV
jgi:hypothetical protein